MTQQSFNCAGSEALQPAAPQSWLCCGFCCDFPLYFSGTLGPATVVNPFFQNSICETNFGWPLVETPVILWRVSPCPSITYAAIGRTFGLFIANDGSVMYPICNGSNLSGTAFTNRWKVAPASTNVTGSCYRDVDGNVVFNMSGVLNNGICQCPFEINAWGGFVTGDCAPGPNDRPPTWCIRYEQSNTYNCITSWYNPSVTGVVTVVSGPHNTTADCNTLCGTSSQNPFWCVNGSCVQSDLRPSGAGGPFENQAACQAACFVDQGEGWYCHNFFDTDLGYSTTGCEKFTNTPANSSQKYDTQAACLAACVTTTTTTTEEPTTTTTTEEPEVPPPGEG